MNFKARQRSRYLCLSCRIIHRQSEIVFVLGRYFLTSNSRVMILGNVLCGGRKEYVLLSLLGQFELFGKHFLALLVFVGHPRFWESDTARSLLRQQLSHSFSRRDQKQKYDESLKAVQYVRQYPDEKINCDYSI